MKVLLINNNPVVGKLVTLSAQKTGDELSSVHSVDDVAAGEYDFVLMDDAGYSDELFDELRTKAEFSKSCFIGSRSTEKPSVFTHEINKPFLPTDLVDIFIKISSDAKIPEQEPQTSEEVLSDDGLEQSAGEMESLDGLDTDLLDDAGTDSDDELIDLDDLEALDSLGDDLALDDLDDALSLDDLNDDLELGDLEDLDENTEELIEEGVSADVTEQKSVLDDDDVKEVQDLLVETDEELSDDLDELLLEEDTQEAGSSFADEATLDEINSALEEIDEEDEDDGAMSLDDALDAFKEEGETAVTADTLGDFDSLDLIDEMEEEAEDDMADLLEDDDKGMNDLLDDLDLDEQSDEAELDSDADEDLGDLLDEIGLDEEDSTEQMPTESLAVDSSIEDTLEGLIDIDPSEISSEIPEEDDLEGLLSEDTTSVDETPIDDTLLDDMDLLDEDITDEEEAASIVEDKGLDELLVGDDILDEAEASGVDSDDLLDESDLLEEDIADEESLTGLLDEDDDLSDEVSIAEDADLEELLTEEAVSDDETDLDALLSATEDDLLDEADLLEEELSEEDEAVTDEASLDELRMEDSGLSEPNDLTEEIASDETEEEKSQDPNEIDLSALNDEIEEALSELDEDDLMSEIDEIGISSLEDELASLSAVDLKVALGEADAADEDEDEDSQIQDEIEALESSVETEEELGLSVGQSEFASLNEEALSEARGDGLIDASDHPELEEVNAFVDEVAVEGASSFDVSSKASTDESIATLENLISTLKQGDVKAALKGMEMNIKISFSEKSE